MRWTEQELDGLPGATGAEAARRQPSAVQDAAERGRPLRARSAAAGTMNKTEAAYDAHLQELRHAGAVLWHKFEAVKLRLADNTFYTCDFSVLPADGVLEMHEVKGFWQDDARVKIKVAASLYPFRFVAVTARAKKRGGGWEREEF
jgi:hypothetical protein